MSGICDTCRREHCHAKMDSLKSCDMHVGGETRWHKLFGTPERAVRTLAVGDRHADCSECVIREACYSSDMGCLVEEPEALLEWLMGDT